MRPVDFSPRALSAIEITLTIGKPLIEFRVEMVPIGDQSKQKDKAQDTLIKKNKRSRSFYYLTKRSQVTIFSSYLFIL